MAEWYRASILRTKGSQFDPSVRPSVVKIAAIIANSIRLLWAKFTVHFWK